MVRVPWSVLMPAWRAVSSVVERTSTVPILTHVLVQIDGGRLRLTADDLSVCVVIEREIEDGGQLSCAVPARQLQDYLKGFSDGDLVGLDMPNPDTLVLSCGRSRARIRVMAADLFPDFEPVGEVKTVEMDAAELRRALAYTIPFVSANDPRPFLQGLGIRSVPEGIDVIGSDGVSAGMWTIEQVLDFKVDCVLPLKAGKHLFGLAEGRERVTLRFAPGDLCVEVEGTRASYRLLGAKWADHRRLLEKEGPTEMQIDRDELRAGLVRGLAVCGKESSGRFFQQPDGLYMDIRGDGSQTEEVVSAKESRGPRLESYGLRLSLLDRAVGVAHGDMLTLRFPSNTNGGCFIRGTDTGRGIAIVMPVRL